MPLQRAQTADGGVGGRSREAPPPRFYNSLQGFNKTHNEPPAWTMTERRMLDLTRGKVHTEIGAQGNIDTIKPSIPSWTQKGRWQGDKPAGHWTPAPGTYANPTTLGSSHPTMPCRGKGWKWGGGERKTMGEGPNTPSPDRYRDDRKDAAIHREPSWSLSGRWVDPQSKEVPPPLKNVQGMRARGGAMTSPEWQFLARPVSSMVPRGSGELPGPGAHSPMYGGIGEPVAPLARIRRSPSCSFGSAARDGPVQGLMD